MSDFCVKARARVASSGFTLTELLVSLTVLSAVLVVLGTVIVSASRSRSATTNQVEAVQAARAGMDMMSRDLRSAGYGSDLDYTTLPQPAIAYIDSMQILINANMAPYPDTTAARLPPRAYNPGGNPKPYPLNGTAWQPPIKYRTGAEVIRWTLDLNNDGAVDAGDVSTAEGADARRTPNPDDYMLVRQVYGDSTGNVAGNNGGAIERISLVRKPGGAVSPLFTVYLRGSSTAWNWASGPIPANKLDHIERVIVNLRATSGRPDWQGRYAETALQLEINSLRNSPNFELLEYAVSGYVFNDLNKNGVKDGSELGIEGASVTLGDYLSLSTLTNGYYQFNVAPGTYMLRHGPAVGFGAFSVDSFLVTVGPSVARSFADTARTGGWVKGIAFNDLDKDGNLDGGEPFMSDVPIYMQSDSAAVEYTDDLGEATLFAQVGGYKVVAVVPDSFAATTPTFYTGTMTKDATKIHKFGMALSNFGTVKGKAFVDNDRDGVFDSGEPEVSNAWVAIVLDDGTVVTFTYTDGSGNYELVAVINDPPHTVPYSVQCIPPSGYAAGSGLLLGPLWLTDGAILTGKNFALGSFYVIKADAKRVLSLASGDLVEKDWASTLSTTPREDVDIVLGAESSGVDNVMVWFNQYDTRPAFASKPTYTRDAPHSVLSIALDSLDATAPRRRLDIVTGTRYTASGNFFVWLTQNTSDNEGFMHPAPTQSCKTLDNGDVNVVRTLNVTGGASPDIIVGTRSPVPGTGTLEVWEHNEANPPTFTRVGQYPPYGAIPGGVLGEVTAIEFADFNKNGLQDIVVATRVSDYVGKVHFLERTTIGPLTVLVHKYSIDLPADAVTGLAVLDMDDDGKQDVVIGTQTGVASGRLHYYRNESGGSTWKFTFKIVKDAPGIVTALTAEDLGSAARKDILLGWRASESSYAGGVQIWYTDAKTLPVSGVDPSGGDVAHMVTGVTTNNFDFGVYPVTPPSPYLKDFAVGVKRNATEGEIIIFIR